CRGRTGHAIAKILRIVTASVIFCTQLFRGASCNGRRPRARRAPERTPMTMTAETLMPTIENAVQSLPEISTDRRTDVEAKQVRVANLLQEFGCDGLLILEPVNFAWLSNGAVARGILDAAELPALYLTADQRWLLSSNVDSQRLFDEELDSLGFQ